MNCGPVITPGYYIPAISVLLIPFLILIQNQTKNQNRPELLLKSARCEIPDFNTFFFNSLSHNTSLLTVISSHPKRTSLIDKAQPNGKVSRSLNFELMSFFLLHLTPLSHQGKSGKLKLHSLRPGCLFGQNS